MDPELERQIKAIEETLKWMREFKKGTDEMYRLSDTFALLAVLVSFVAIAICIISRWT